MLTEELYMHCTAVLSGAGSLTSAGVQTPASQIQSADGVAQLPVTARPSQGLAGPSAGPFITPEIVITIHTEPHRSLTS